MLEFDPDVYDKWELWLAAVEQIDDRSQADALLLNAITSILSGETDLSQAGPSSNVLGRLLAAIDLQSSPLVRDGVIACFDDDRIGSHDLWVLTSLLAKFDWATWFTADLVLADDADARQRRRMRDRISNQWPYIGARYADGTQVGGTGVAVAPELLDRWDALQTTLGALPASGPPEQLIWELILLSRLNEAASLLAAQDDVTAQLVMNELEEAIGARYQSPNPPDARAPGAPAAPGGPETLPTIPGGEEPRAVPSGLRGGRGPNAPPRVAPPPSTSTVRVGQAIGTDGEWAASYDEARNADEKLEALRSLRQTAGTDLGPLDAEQLVKVAYRGAPQEVRTIAGDLVVELFATGPNVAMEMRDQFHDASATELTSELVSRLTGHLMPSPRVASWEIEGVLALVEHALGLRRTSSIAIDQLVELLSSSYRSRAEILGGKRTPPTPLSAPQEAALQVAQAWLDRAQPLIVAAPLPDDLPGLDRRRETRMRLVQSPIQQFVGWQISTLDAMAYVSTAEQPARRDDAAMILADCAVDRARADEVLLQAIVTEQAMTRLWRLRMRAADSSSAMGLDGGSARTAFDRFTMLVLVAIGVSGNDNDFEQRLLALDPATPMDYFELAEEIADVADDQTQHDLARRLFGLAGVLDRHRLGRSACLALADLETEPTAKRRLLALASLLGERDAASLREWGGGVEPTSEAALAIATSFARYRTGDGAKALEALEGPGVMSLLESHQDALLGGLRRYREDCKLYRGRLRPSLSDADIDRMLQLELLLIAGMSRPWSSELLLGYAHPLIEVDPDQLEESLGIDASRSIYRDGRWIQP